MARAIVARNRHRSRGLRIRSAVPSRVDRCRRALAQTLSRTFTGPCSRAASQLWGRGSCVTIKASTSSSTTSPTSDMDRPQRRARLRAHALAMVTRCPEARSDWPEAASPSCWRNRAIILGFTSAPAGTQTWNAAAR